jgi:hypothetical protein
MRLNVRCLKNRQMESSANELRPILEEGYNQLKSPSYDKQHLTSHTEQLKNEEQPLSTRVEPLKNEGQDRIRQERSKWRDVIKY